MSKKKALAIIIGVLAVFVLAAVYLFFASFRKYDGQSVASVDKDLVVSSVNDMLDGLSEDDYEKILAVCKDWEQSSGGEIYRDEFSINYDLSRDDHEFLYLDMRRLGFKAMSIYVFNSYAGEVGVKLVRDEIAPETDLYYHETAEYGLCYIYGDVPDYFVSYGIDNSFANQYWTYHIEEVYNGLYAYVMYMSNCPV